MQPKIQTPYCLIPQTCIHTSSPQRARFQRACACMQVCASFHLHKSTCEQLFSLNFNHKILLHFHSSTVVPQFKKWQYFSGWNLMLNFSVLKISNIIWLNFQHDMFSIFCAPTQWTHILLSVVLKKTPIISLNLSRSENVQHVPKDEERSIHSHWCPCRKHPVAVCFVTLLIDHLFSHSQNVFFFFVV